MIGTDNELNLTLETWPYKDATTILVPYRESATNFFPGDYLMSLWCRLEQEDLLTTIFPGVSMDHPNKLIRYLSTHATLICLTRNERDITDTAGIGYIAESNGVDGARNASFGFGFFRNHWATPQARTLSYLMLAFWMRELKVDVLFGTTLRANGLAKNFSLNFGFKNHLDIPKLFFRNGRLEDATIMMLEKDDFEPRYEAWRETWDVIQAPVVQ
jgi:hypothetical protein